MKLISTPKHLQKEFKRLTEKYTEYYWITAWAGSPSKLFDDLLKREERVKKIIVGLHFYQTHPDFIEKYMNDERVRFIKQSDGTFHPKMFLFTDGGNWEMITGSANFTNAAFTKNTEAGILISNKEDKNSEVFQHALNLITRCWNEASQFNEDDLRNYRNIWTNHRQKIKSLSGHYGSAKKKSKPIFESAVANRTWHQFLEEVKSETYHGLNKRLRVIEIAQQIFSKQSKFKNMTDDERKFIAGIPNELNIDGAVNWAFFGSMRGAGIFKNRISENDENISKALDQIPYNGQITQTHYKNFISLYEKAFDGNYIATATRLLCMKRPDTFICFDSQNKSALCRDFGITQSGMNYKRYWEDIIERIYDSNWWKNPEPKNHMEEKVSNARAAFLDSLYYLE